MNRIYWRTRRQMEIPEWARVTSGRRACEQAHAEIDSQVENRGHLVNALIDGDPYSDSPPCSFETALPIIEEAYRNVGTGMDFSQDAHDVILNARVWWTEEMARWEGPTGR